MTPRRLFHYTIGKERLDSILTSGEIRCADAFIQPGERPAVWFSYAPVMEPTAWKDVQDSTGRRTPADPERVLREGLFRIEVQPDAAPFTWYDYRTESGISTASYRALERAAKREGSDVSLWRVSFAPVLSGQFVAIERASAIPFGGISWTPQPFRPSN